MGLPAGTCVTLHSLLWFIAEPPQGFNWWRTSKLRLAFSNDEMWVEVISNEFRFIYGTNAFSTLHECSLSIHGTIEHSLILFKLFFFLSLKGAELFFLSFLSMNFDNSNFRSMTSYESHAGKRSHVFEASRPLHLFDQQLGCEFCRSESGSEAPWGPPFTPATSRG